jgi:sarcosine oxidase subunit gamma
VAELAAQEAWEGLGLPLAVGGATLAALPQAALWIVAPYRGRAEAAAAALGAAWPAPGRSVAVAGGRLVWSGLDQALLIGAGPEGIAGRLAGLAAAVDVSDGWAGLALAGPAAADVLARLVPLDLAPAAFPPGAAARSQLRHVACLIEAVAEGYEIRVARSVATTAVHDLAAAMRAVAARAGIAAAR